MFTGASSVLNQPEAETVFNQTVVTPQVNQTSPTTPVTTAMPTPTGPVQGPGVYNREFMNGNARLFEPERWGNTDSFLSQPPQRTPHPENLVSTPCNPNPELQNLASGLNSILQPMEQEITFQADYNIPIRAGGSKKQCVPINTQPLDGQPLTQREISTWQQASKAGLVTPTVAYPPDPRFNPAYTTQQNTGTQHLSDPAYTGVTAQNVGVQVCQPEAMSWNKPLPKARPDEMERLLKFRAKPCLDVIGDRRRMVAMQKMALQNQRRAAETVAAIAQAAVNEVMAADTADATPYGPQLDSCDL